MDLSDQQLIRNIRAGKAQAFDLIIARYQRPIRRSLFHLTKGDRALVDDLTQEVFILAYKNIAQFQGQGKMTAWLLKIAYRCFLAHYKRVKKSAAVIDDTAEMPDVKAEIPKQSTVMDVAAAMALLPPAERFAIDLCFTHGYSHSEAAKIMSIPLGTCKSHIGRGKEKLKIYLKGYHDD